MSIVSELCAYSKKNLICLKNRRCETCPIYLNRTEEYPKEWMPENQCFNRMMQIIHEEIARTKLFPEKSIKEIHDKIQNRIKQFMEKQQLVIYRP